MPAGAAGIALAVLGPEVQGMAKKRATKRTTAKKTTRKAAKRYVRRDEKGQFKESDDVGKAAASDQRKRAKAKATRGQGDKGDR